MTRPYQQENINQDGNVVFYSGTADPTEVTLSGGGGLLAVIDTSATGTVEVFLPLANEAGRNAEVTVTAARDLSGLITISPQAPAAPLIPDVIEQSTPLPGYFPSAPTTNTLAGDYASLTYTSNGENLWVLTAGNN
jgi:hypothetical protein